MTLEYLYINHYRRLNSQGLNFSNRFNISFDDKRDTLTIEENPFYIEEFYGKVVSSLSGIIGQNGVGKTTILNYIKEVISFPVSLNPDAIQCILVFFNALDSKITIATTGYSILEHRCKYPDNTSIEILDLSDLLKEANTSDRVSKRDSILSRIPDYKDNAILYLSNVFDARSERDYGPQIEPFVYNLSINYLTNHEAVNAEEKATYKVNEIYKIIKLVLNSKQQIPAIKLPDLIRISFRSIIISEYLKVSENYKGESNYKDPFREDITAALTHISEDKETNNNKENRVRFWLSCNLLIQISGYYNGSLTELSKVIRSSTNLNLLSNLLNFFFSNISSFSLENKKRRQNLSSDFSWKEYFDNYELFSVNINSCVNNDQSKKEHNSFTVPLIDRNEQLINDTIILYEKVTISTEILSFGWDDLSTGETMLLRFFANLYSFSIAIGIGSTPNFSNILLLIDEIETFYHPQWQKKIVKTLIDFLSSHFNGCSFQIIFTSHSPLTISDIPKSNLIFLKRENDKVIVQKDLNDHKQTFAANIHTLLSDSFFLQEGLIGDFANSKISNVIDILVDGKLSDIVEKRDYIESIINIIGEPVIKAKLLELLENRLRANLLTIKRDLDQIKFKRS